MTSEYIFEHEGQEIQSTFDGLRKLQKKIEEVIKKEEQSVWANQEPSVVPANVNVDDRSINRFPCTRHEFVKLADALITADNANNTAPKGVGWEIRRVILNGSET